MIEMMELKIDGEVFDKLQELDKPQEKKEYKTVEDLEKELAQFTGTEHYYQHMLGLKCTDGVEWLCGIVKAFWFLDLISSYQGEAKVKACPFQIWRVHSEGENSFVDMRGDSDAPVIIRQDIQYTTFPKGEYEVYCIDGIVLLKSEF